MFLSTADAARTHKERRRAIRGLLRHSEAELADVGMARSVLEAALYAPTPPSLPTLHQQSRGWARRR